MVPPGFSSSSLGFPSRLEAWCFSGAEKVTTFKVLQRELAWRTWRGAASRQSASVSATPARGRQGPVYSPAAGECFTCPGNNEELIFVCLIIFSSLNSCFSKFDPLEPAAASPGVWLKCKSWARSHPDPRDLRLWGPGEGGVQKRGGVQSVAPRPSRWYRGT